MSGTCEHVDPPNIELCGKTDYPNFSLDANIWW